MKMKLENIKYLARIGFLVSQLNDVHVKYRKARKTSTKVTHLSNMIYIYNKMIIEVTGLHNYCQRMLERLHQKRVELLEEEEE